MQLNPSQPKLAIHGLLAEENPPLGHSAEAVMSGSGSLSLGTLASSFDLREIPCWASPFRLT